MAIGAASIGAASIGALANRRVLSRGSFAWTKLSLDPTSREMGRGATDPARTWPGWHLPTWSEHEQLFCRFTEGFSPRVPISFLCKKQYVCNGFMDEAGGTPTPSLTRSALRFDRTFQLRAYPLRTLSLGVLIVCGGTLAALPFRRYHSIHDASAEPSQVTGPSQTELHSTQFDPTRASDAERLTSLSQSQIDDRLSAYADAYAVASSPANQRRRQLDIPLTYEDLAVPIDQPKPIMERFNATAPVRQQQLQAEQIAQLVMPPMESLPVHQQEELHRVAESIRSQPEAGRAAGRLASASAPPLGRGFASDAHAASTYEPLQQPGETERERFWIRQPE